MIAYVILDANFLLMPTEFNIDIYKEFNRIVEEKYIVILFRATITELEKKIARLTDGKVKFQHQYQLALRIFENQPHQIIEKDRESGQLVDDFILDQALSMQNEETVVYVATNDKELRRNCREEGVLTIFMRSQKKLVIE